MPTVQMQRHVDYDPRTTVQIAAVTGMVAGDRVFDTTTGQPNYRSNGGVWERYIVVNVGQAAFPVGALAAPSITFDGDPDTGFYNAGANLMIAVAGGAQVCNFVSAPTPSIQFPDGAAATPSITYYTAGDTNTGFFRPGADQLGFTTGGTERMRVGSGGIVFIGDGTTTTNTFQTIGLTIDQLANDDEIFAGLSTGDVDHGMTAIAGTSTYVTLDKVEGDSGGVRFRGYKDADGINAFAISIEGILGEGADTTKSSAGNGIVSFFGAIKSGVTFGNVNADANVFSFRTFSGGAARTLAILDAEGTLHVDLAGNGSAAAPAITGAGDVDTGFWWPANNDIVVATSGSDRWTFKSGGQLWAITQGSKTSVLIGRSADPDTGIYYPAANVLGLSAGSAPFGLSNAAITLAAASDTVGASIYAKVEAGGADTDNSGGEDGGDFTIGAGDGSDAGGGVTAGGDGGDHRIQSGTGGAGAGGGAAGADGLVFIEKSDNGGFWDDIRIVPGAFQFAGASDPTLSAWQPTGAGATFQVYEFDNGDEVFFTCQIPHSYREGTDLRPHVHWTPRARGIAENGNTVFWRLDFSLANPNANFPASITVQLHDTCNGVNERHEVTDSQGINGAGVTISAVLVCRLYRAAGDTWSLNTAGNRPALLEFDLHFETNSNGSRAEFTK